MKLWRKEARYWNTRAGEKHQGRKNKRHTAEVAHISDLAFCLLCRNNEFMVAELRRRGLTDATR